MTFHLTQWRADLALATGLIALTATGALAAEGTNDPIARIRDEGMNRSEVTNTLSYLTDVIGPRLTGSPNLKRANEWTLAKLTGWGLTNGHLEAWGPFGRGWSLKRFSAQVIEPQTIPLVGYPAAWSPGFEKPLVANVIYFNARTNTDLEKYQGKLKGAIVLSGNPREINPRFEPLSRRLTETNLLELANAPDPEPEASPTRPGRRSGRLELGKAAEDPAHEGDNTEVSNSTEARRGKVLASPAAAAAQPPRPPGRRRISATNSVAAATNTVDGGARSSRFAGRFGRSSNRYLPFLAKEGAALVVTPSFLGEAGTFFVAAASVPSSDIQGTNTNFGSFTNTPRAWATNAPHVPPQITLAAEDFNRLVRMIQQDQTLKMAVDLQVQFHDDDLMAYNTVAEIPGSDLKDEVVMLGAHLDSWHSGTGATDNGAGVAATMEAMRILSVLKVQPRRTIRIGLWSGEEQGLYGSKSYVSNHFGYYRTVTNVVALRAPKDEQGEEAARFVSNKSGETNGPATTRKLARQPEHDKFSAYFNLDNGGGKIRGMHMQGNEGVRPLFRRWLEPFRDLGAETLTISDTGGTDHQSFDAVGLPGFQFIQDPLDYSTKTHHSNQDVYDRIQAEDLKQAAVILAAFAYDAAMADEKLPRKPEK